ncbi:alpha-galactosidase [Saccharopolyspora erythraea]|uniref:alpha-galactosidase n=1 Tax=Saccharopolyspora erythraea TaxID=1836 RepID=UPI001BA68DAB|nr:alpha-galactosidase [Saccharopolyspora erythraea]QUH01996.1 alpha-galactosidase [Saccharopolyspora erythraea]
MTNFQIVHLGTDEVSLVVDARGSGLPVVVHWGASLGEPDQNALENLVRATARPVAHNALDEPVPFSLLAQPGLGHPGRPGLSGHRGGQAWSPLFCLSDVTRHGRSVLFEAVDKQAALTLFTEIELTDSGVLRQRHRLRNDAAEEYTVDALEVSLPVPARAGELLDFTGRHCRERAPQRHPFAFGSWVRENRRGRTGHDASLQLVAGTPGFGFAHGEVWAAHVAWSGNHVTYAERLVEGPSVLGGGELLLPGEVVLPAGEEYASPWFYAAYSPRGLDGISAGFHHWLRSRPEHPRSSRPVVLNTWEAVYFDHELDRLRELADVAARVGVERFVLDDGWFRHRRDDQAGLGDWYVDEQVWPEGLHPLVDHVRGQGMEFGLWVEPEMINPDSDLYRAHPDWVLAPGTGELPPPSRYQQVLDLAIPDAYTHILERLDALLTEYAIGYLKWDHNRDLVAAGHAGRPGVRAQTLALYRLLDELRSRHPGVEIESCSSGGGRIDLEVLRRTDRVWTSDCNDALERQSIQRWTGQLLPPELMGTHVGPPRAHTTGRTHDLSFRVATALFGHFGIEWDIASATEQEQAGLAAAIELHKDLRALLHSGHVVRVDHPDPSAYLHGVVAQDRAEALFCYAQLATSTSAVAPPLRLPGLEPDRDYRVEVVDPVGSARLAQRAAQEWWAAGEIVLTGRALAEVGLQPPVLEPEQALLLRITSNEAG